MRTLLSFILIACGLLVWVLFGYNIFTLLILMLFCFVAGFIGGNSHTSKDSDNLSAITQMERNKYFRR